MEQLVTGFIRSPHGVSGKFKVESLSGECEHFFALTEITLRHGATEKHCKVQSVEGNAAALIMKCEGIDTPEAVKNYAGWEIVVPRSSACPLRKGEYYNADLRQCVLVWIPSDKDVNGGLAANAAPVQIGTVTDVLEGGAGYLLEVSLSESCAVLDDNNIKCGATVLIPFKSEFVKVNTAERTIQLMHLWILE